MSLTPQQKTERNKRVASALISDVVPDLRVSTPSGDPARDGVMAARFALLAGMVLSAIDLLQRVRKDLPKEGVGETLDGLIKELEADA